MAQNVPLSDSNTAAKISSREQISEGIFRFIFVIVRWCLHTFVLAHLLYPVVA